MTKHTYTQILKMMFDKYFDFSFMSPSTFYEILLKVFDMFCEIFDILAALTAMLLILFIKLTAPISYPIIALIAYYWHNKEYKKQLANKVGGDSDGW